MAECPNLRKRRQIQRRFRLRGKIRRAIAEAMGTADYGTVQVDSQSLETDGNNINCEITISIHHFNTDIEINMQSHEQLQGHSGPVTKLIESCNNGTLASVKYIIIQNTYDCT